MIHKARRTLRRHGLIGTVALAFEKLGRVITGRQISYEHSFDQEHGVDTGGNEDVRASVIVDGVTRASILDANRNQATSPELFWQMIATCPIPLEGATFIDCGCGKGRMLLLASELPFKRVIGIEFMADVASIARQNASRYSPPTRKVREITIVNGDATMFALPNEPTVLFIANPFEGATMAKFLRGIEDSLRREPRPFAVLYRQAKAAELWNRSTVLKHVHHSEWFDVYVARTPA